MKLIDEEFVRFGYNVLVPFVFQVISFNKEALLLILTCSNVKIIELLH